MKPTIILNKEAIYNLKCFHGCNDAIVGVYYFPDGCVCDETKLQALCLNHMIKADSNIVHGEMIELISFK